MTKNQLHKLKMVSLPKEINGCSVSVTAAAQTIQNIIGVHEQRAGHLLTTIYAYSISHVIALEQQNMTSHGFC